MIDSKEAAAALDDIEQMTRRVRRSQVYNLSSLMLMLWGGLVFAGNLVTYLWPRYAGSAWIIVWALGFAGSIAIGAAHKASIGIRSFDARIAAAFVVFIGFGFVFLCVIGTPHLTPRQLSTFWPTYYMMAYTLTGLWFGPAFVVIGLAITALTLIGYFL